MKPEAPMKCPRCVKRLARRPVGGVEVDICLACEGAWFDAGEIRRVMKAEPVPERSALAPCWIGRPIKGEVPGETDLACPRCGKSLERLFYEGRSSVLVDRCRRGCGVWVDDGEVREVFGWEEKRRWGLRRLLAALASLFRRPR